MRNPTPAPIVVPVSGTPTCRSIELAECTLSEWRHSSDDGKDADMIIKACADRATRDGAVLCLRPTADGKGACVGMTPTAFAVASLAEDFAVRALVVDPYDMEGNDIREGTIAIPDPLPEWPRVENHEARLADAWAAAVAVWEGSERV